MAYLGNNLQVAFSSYKIIDNISASFNGSTTSFSLTVNGVTPVPAPINVQQCLISVGGIPQKPDPSGVDGFNLVGGNIVFSSAPAAGLKFWGVILAGADYVTAGTAYPNGSENNPSVTFSSNTSTGLYLFSPNVLGFAANGASIATLSSSGLSLGASTTLSSSGLSLGASTTLSSSGLSLGASTTLSSLNLKLNGSVSGAVTVVAPAIAGNNSITLPTGNGSAYQILRNSGTAGSLEFADKIVSETAKAWNWNGLTTNSLIDFTGIPSWVKRVTVVFSEVSTNGSQSLIIQIGTSSGMEITGYNSFCSNTSGGAAFTTGFGVDSNVTSTNADHGTISIVNMTGNTWVYSSLLTNITAGSYKWGAGTKTLAGTLDRIRVTNTGANMFDAGLINILYE
jgi:hypothetical protein